MQPRPRVIVFDVNEALSDMAPMARRLRRRPRPARHGMVRRRPAGRVRAGRRRRQGGIQPPGPRAALAGTSLNHPAAEAADHILAGFGGLSVHPDVPDGVRLLCDGGMRLVMLSNGSADVAGRLLAKAGIGGEFEQLLSVEDADAWKPAPAAYAHAARACSVPIGQMLLVAVHPWDIHGAHQAGMRTGWITRQSAPYPGYVAAPTCEHPT